MECMSLLKYCKVALFLSENCSMYFNMKNAVFKNFIVISACILKVYKFDRSSWTRKSFIIFHYIISLKNSANKIYFGTKSKKLRTLVDLII